MTAGSESRMQGTFFTSCPTFSQLRATRDIKRPNDQTNRRKSRLLLPCSEVLHQLRVVWELSAKDLAARRVGVQTAATRFSNQV